MADRVVLHIGTMKSGTTYVQRLLETGAVEAAGAFFVGGCYRAQSKAVDHLGRWTGEQAPRAWQHLARGVRRRDGVAIYSHEFLSFSPDDRVAKVVGSFGGAPVDVVLTVRDRATTLPAQWQSYIRNRGTESWAEYVEGISHLRGRGRARRQARQESGVKAFLRCQDVPGMIQRWGSQPEVASVNVALVPPPGSPPELLWQRFCEAAGLDVPCPPDSGTRQNPSLGYASCELVRLLNPSLVGLSRVEHERARRPVVSTLLALRGSEGRPVLDDAGQELAHALNRRVLRSVERHGARLVGDPADLPVSGDPVGLAAVPPPDEAQVRRAFETAWTQCVPGTAVPQGVLEDGVQELGRRLAARFGS